MRASCAVVVVAGGTGTRAGGELPKQFQPLAGVPLFLWSLRFFARHSLVSEIVLVVHPDYWEIAERLLREDGLETRVKCVAGGAKRQESVLAGVRAVGGEAEVVAVHDAARPFPPENLGDALAACEGAAGAIFAARVTDTIKREESGLIAGTVAREGLWAAQTPQLARRELLLRALSEGAERGIELTDEASALEQLGEKVALVESSRTNIKVTLPEDWLMAEAIARTRGMTGIDIGAKTGSIAGP